jgi:hypothetical protein
VNTPLVDAALLALVIIAAVAAAGGLLFSATEMLERHIARSSVDKELATAPPALQPQRRM